MTKIYFSLPREKIYSPNKMQRKPIFDNKESYRKLLTISGKPNQTNKNPKIQMTFFAT